MKTSEITPAIREEQARDIAAGLNRSKHASPHSVLRALNIPETLAHQDIEVTHAKGDFWAGSKGCEFAKKLGPSPEYAAKVIAGLKLP